MKKRILSLALTLGLVMTLCPTALAAGKGLSNFQKSAAYTAGTFTDVPASTWYTENVKTAYELGLMKGTSSVAFSPDGNITVGSAIALACRLHSIYETGGANFIQGNPWYQVYVDYALKNGIITQGQFTNYDAVATRRQFAAILAKALPEEALEEKNTVEDGTIPDLAAGSANYDDIYLLYRAGILTGSDSKGTFVPESTITRSSVAAIVSRMAMPQLRQSVTMKVVPATKLTMNQTSLTLEEGKTSTLTVTPSPADATVTNVTWKSSNTSVATVDNGKVTAVKKGSATITATTANGVKATCKVTVTPAPVEVTGVSLNKSTMSLAEGTTGRLTATVKPSDATNDSVTWSSSNTSVATVSSGGTVTAKREGTATITVTTYNGKTATCKVTVTPEIKVSSVTVDPSSLTLEVGDSEYLSASVYPANATDDSVEWESSDTSVATVNSSGTVTAVAPGTARITATAENGRYDYCRVTVNASTAIDFSVPELDKNYGPMTIVTSIWIYRFYKLLFALSLILCMALPGKNTGELYPRRPIFRKFYHANMIFCMIMPFILSLYYSYATDYQPQGRYILPMLLPFAYYCVRGLCKGCALLERRLLFKNDSDTTNTPAKKRLISRPSTGVCILLASLIVISLFVTVYGYAFPYYELHPVAP